MDIVTRIIVDIVRATDNAGGVSPTVWEIPVADYEAAETEVRGRRAESDLPFLSAPIDRPNFLLAGVPVVAVNG
jgi:hypothetical protein